MEGEKGCGGERQQWDRSPVVIINSTAVMELRHQHTTANHASPTDFCGAAKLLVPQRTSSFINRFSSAELDNIRNQNDLKTVSMLFWIRNSSK